MENLKIQIKIEDNDDLKEVHGLLLELGFSTYSEESFGVWADHPKPIWLKTNCFDDNSNKIDWCFKESHGECKEITIQKLRDLVVLKRNDVGGANYKTNYGTQCYITGEDVYAFQDNKWFLSAMQHKDILDMIKPIEKPMKEYLRKNSNGTYSYIGTVRPEHVSDFMIEIPDGAETFNFYDRKDNLFFLKGTGENALFSNDLNDWEWSHWGDIDFDGVVCLWKRHTHPEELPFIDDEPKIETATGYQLDVVGSNTYGSRSRYDGESDISYRQYLMNFIVGNRTESLNDQYAEIEKVRQSHRTASEIADSALKHIRERAETYDQPTGERSATKTAKAFNAITGKDITESEVWLLLQLLKDVRQWSREDYHQDSAEDCIAYAALKAESLEGGNETQ